MLQRQKINKSLPRLGKDFYIHPDHVNVKGGAEHHIAGLGRTVMIPAAYVNVKGGAQKYIPGLGKSFFIHPSHVELVAPTIALSTTAITNADVTATVTFPAGATGKEYKIGEFGTYGAYTVPVVMSAPGVFYARYADANGSKSAEALINVNHLDKGAPVVTVTPDTTESAEAVVLSVTAVDPMGIASLKYLADTTAKVAADFASAGTAIVGGAFTVSANATVTVYAKDRAGNETVESIVIANIA